MSHFQQVNLLIEEEDYANVFEIVYMNDLLYGVNIKSQTCKINDSCNNNECINSEEIVVIIQDKIVIY